MTVSDTPAVDMEARIEALLEAMTLEEQVSLLAGADFWSTVPNERLNIPVLKVSDGPNGARGGGALVGGVKAASFPVGISLASSWNTELVGQVGGALADEAHSKGARVLLAPTVNLHRSPLNGRNFECYSEDPYLSAQMAVAYIQGLQNKGVGATVKHYVGNESEFERMSISSEIGERALRELYLVPFEAAVKQGNAWALMAAYNKVNGVFASEHPRTLDEILKQEWGFDGVVMSDWFATHSTAEGVNAGLDLEMPGPAMHRGQKLLEAVQAGEASADAVKDSARRILRLMLRVGSFDDPTIPEEQANDLPEHRALIRRAGAEGTVMLKNNGVLPLDQSVLESIALIGPNARTAQIMGGGSAQVNAHYRVSPLDGIRTQAENLELRYAPGCTNYKLLPLMQTPFTVDYMNGSELAGPVLFTQEIAEGERMWFEQVAPQIDRASFSARMTTSYTPESAGEHVFSLVSAGKSRLLLEGKLLIDNWDAWAPGDTFFGAGSREAFGSAELETGRSYQVVVEYATTPGGFLNLAALRVGVTKPLGDAAIDEAVALAAQADVAVVFAGLNGEWDSEGADRPHMDLVGRQDELIAKVAAANPRTVVVLQTGGPVAMPWLESVAAVLQAWYPGQECGNSVADVLFGIAEPGGRLPQTFPQRLADNPAFVNYPGENGKVSYGEGIFIGYRYYEKKQVAPLFAFGYGLGYTTFAYSNLRLSTSTLAAGGSVTVEVDVTNTGARPGTEVVQVYVRDPESRLVRPEKELKGFAKLAIEPGETATAQIELDMRAFAYYDDARAAWVADAGQFDILVGSASDAIHASASLTLEGEWAAPVKAA